MHMSAEPAKAYDIASITHEGSRLTVNLPQFSVASSSDLERHARKKERWDLVLNKKTQNTETKTQHIRDLLGKQFRRDQIRSKRLQESQEESQYLSEKRAERFDQNRQRKGQLDVAEQKRRVKEFAIKSQKLE